MTDFFSLHTDTADINSMSSLSIAYLGDAVFELMVRTRLCLTSGNIPAGELHAKAVDMVRASAQAEMAERLMPLLNDAEKDVFRRGRNSKVHTTPHSASKSDYHAATGLEMLFGYLYLRGETDRLNELFAAAMEVL
ncbi:MAG: ribonuclease III [Oscillospiraceae bacterium]|nr:ribonuclease III [Oscillospiraceae bacterium]